MIIDKDGIRCYTDENENIFHVSIRKYSDDAKQILKENEQNIKRICIESTDCLFDFSLFPKFKNLKILEIHPDYKAYDIAFVNELTKLECLGAGKFTGVLCNDGIKKLGYKWHKKSDISKCTNIDYINVSNCSDLESFISQLSSSKKVRTLGFFRIASRSFPENVEPLPVVEVDFSYCPKLESMEGLHSSCPNVRKLVLDHCCNIKDYLPIGNLTNLEELKIFDSSPITDLSFLENMPNLKHLKIGKTKIAAENIEILENIQNVDLLKVGI